MHDPIAIGTLVLLFAGILLNRHDVTAAETRINQRLDRLEATTNAGFNRVNDHLIIINNTMGEHEIRLAKKT